MVLLPTPPFPLKITNLLDLLHPCVDAFFLLLYLFHPFFHSLLHSGLLFGDWQWCHVWTLKLSEDNIFLLGLELHGGTRGGVLNKCISHLQPFLAYNVQHRKQYVQPY